MWATTSMNYPVVVGKWLFMPHFTISNFHSSFIFSSFVAAELQKTLVIWPPWPLCDPKVSPSTGHILITGFPKKNFVMKIWITPPQMIDGWPLRRYFPLLQNLQVSCESIHLFYTTFRRGCCCVFFIYLNCDDRYLIKPLHVKPDSRRLVGKYWA